VDEPSPQVSELLIKDIELYWVHCGMPQQSCLVLQHAAVVSNHIEMSGLERECCPVDELTSSSRLAADNGNVFGAEDHRSDGREPGLQIHCLVAIQAQLALTIGPGPLKCSSAVCRVDDSLDPCTLCPGLYPPTHPGLPEALQGRQDVHRFQDIGLALGVVAVKEDEASITVEIDAWAVSPALKLQTNQSQLSVQANRHHDEETVISVW